MGHQSDGRVHMNAGQETSHSLPACPLPTLEEGKAGGRQQEQCEPLPRDCAEPLPRDCAEPLALTLHASLWPHSGPWAHHRAQGAYDSKRCWHERVPRRAAAHSKVNEACPGGQATRNEVTLLLHACVTLGHGGGLWAIVVPGRRWHNSCGGTTGDPNTGDPNTYESTPSTFTSFMA